MRRFRTAAAALALLAAPAAPAAGQGGAAGSQILWDTWGVPHVFASSLEDLGWGFGWAQMHSHGDAVLRLYGAARGRAAEYWGERHLASDRFVRTLGIPEAARAQVAEQPAEFLRYLEAFADGANAYARAHPERIADSLRVVLPVTAADLLAHTHRAVLTFLAGTGNEPPLLGRDATPTPFAAGSNAWAVAPGRSASGHALLLANPHLPWTGDLMRFFEAQLSGPGIDLSGATLIGVPVLVIGFNDRLGWSHTVNTIDALDVYRLTPAEGGYRFDGAVRPFETGRQTLRVRAADGTLRDEPLVVRRSVHGPVVRIDDTLALAVATPELGQGGALRQWWDMGRAGSLEEFEGALRRQQLSMFNVVYADRDGHILYLFNGRIPARPAGDFAFWQRAVRGDTSALLWREIVPYDGLPRVVDPPSGFVQNSNSPPWFATMPSPLDPERFPAWLAPRWLGFREQRGLRMLLADSSITFEELLAMRHSSRMELADRLLDDLLPAARASGRPLALEAAGVLERWDRTAAADSRGGALFALWAQPLFSATPADPRGFAVPWSADRPLATPDGLADPEAAVAALERAAQLVRSRFGALDVPWGEAFTLGDGLPGVGAPGDPLGVFHVIAYAATAQGPFRAVAGDTYVAAVEFGPSGPRARAILGYGNASQPGSPHRGDQLRLIAGGEMRPVWRTRAEVEAHLEETTHIRRER